MPISFPGAFSIVDPILFFISPRAPITTESTVAFIFHILLTLIFNSLYFENFSTSLIDTCMFEGIVNICVYLHIQN